MRGEWPGPPLVHSVRQRCSSRAEAFLEESFADTFDAPELAQRPGLPVAVAEHFREQDQPDGNDAAVAASEPLDRLVDKPAVFR